jgi:hypothetical protein
MPANPAARRPYHPRVSLTSFLGVVSTQRDCLMHHSAYGKT